MRLQRYIFLRKYAIPKNNENEDAITAIGTTLSQMTSVLFAITSIRRHRGLIDAAAVGIVEKFIGLVFIVPSAMLSTVSAISAQNIGGRKYGTCQANHAHRHDDNHWLWFGYGCKSEYFRYSLGEVPTPLRNVRQKWAKSRKPLL